MGIRCDEYEGVCVLSVEGDLAGDLASEVQRLCDARLTPARTASFVFDLGDCGFIDSAGLETLCRVRRKCDEAGTHVALARVSSDCARILQITRLAARFDCHAGLTSAVSAAR